MSNNSKYPRIPRNVVFCGEVGTGKSSAINLLLKSGTLANVSNDSQPCTQVSTRYETTLNGTKYNLWDTRGLGEGRKFSIQGIFRRKSEKELKKFLKERHHRHELDLLVYCIRGTRAYEGSVKHYNSICAITRQLFAPVVVMVSHLERERDMEDWWNRNSSGLEKLKMEFDGHVCITTLAGHPHLANSKKRLIDLITGNRHWCGKSDGPQFDLPARRPTSPTPPFQGGISILFKPKPKDGVGNGGINRHPSHCSGSSSTATSPRNSSYHTPAQSPRELVPPGSVVEPPTPCHPTTYEKLTHAETGLLEVGDAAHSPSEETSSMRSSLHSMFYTSSHSSYTPSSEAHLQSLTEGSEDHLSEQPFQHLTATVRRRQRYPTRHGAFGDVWECELISRELPRMVAVKAVKTNSNDDEDLRSREKKLRRELKVWGRLRHRNIVPLLGVVGDFGPLPSMVSPWFRNGSLSRYLAHHQTLNLSEKHRLLKDMAAGLRYLHSQEVVHGDLHSDNVLIDDDGTACLTDFGLSLIKDFVGTSYLKSDICGGVQFADPALVQRINTNTRNDIVSYPTKPCDVYSFGGLMLHVLSGKKPYEGIPAATTILVMVLKGEQPQIPTQDKHITKRHKSVIQLCWDREELKRPSADDLVRTFEPW